MIEEESEYKKYRSLIILDIYIKMQEFRAKNNNKRPTHIKIGKKELLILKNLNLDWKLRNEDPNTIMGLKIEKVDNLDINQIEVR